MLLTRHETCCIKFVSCVNDAHRDMLIYRCLRWKTYSLTFIAVDGVSFDILMLHLNIDTLLLKTIFFFQLGRLCLIKKSTAFSAVF